MVLVLLGVAFFCATTIAVSLALESGFGKSFETFSKSLTLRLRQAGASASVHRLHLLWALGVCVGGLGLSFLFDSMWMGLLGMALGACFPWALAAYLEKRKLEKFGAQLSSLLDLFCGALRSGQSLNQALATLATEAPQPAQEYFGAVSQKIALGQPPEIALDELAGELKGASCAEELRMLSTAVSVTRATGGNLAEIINQLSDTLRERERLRAEIGAMTAQGKLSGWIVGGLPVLILLALNIMDPGLVAPMFHSSLGLGMLALGLILEGMGAFLISRIVSIDA